MAKHQPDDWVPDARPIIWAFGRADPQRIKDAVRLDVQDRAPDPRQHPDEYWAFVAEAAIEALPSRFGPTTRPRTRPAASLANQGDAGWPSDAS